MQRTWLIGGCLIAAISVFLSPLPSAPLDQRAPAVKLIEYGWDSPSAEFVRAHVAEMERRPFDGVIVRLSDGGGDVFQPAKWNAETLALQLPILREDRSDAPLQLAALAFVARPTAHRPLLLW